MSPHKINTNSLLSNEVKSSPMAYLPGTTSNNQIPSIEYQHSRKFHQPGHRIPENDINDQMSTQRKGLNIERQRQKERLERKKMVIGISGCTSSGKNLLAGLLGRVFDAAIVIHQDSYSQPKALCPITSYTAHKSDLEYVHHSMTNNDNSEYYVTSKGRGASDYKIVGPDTDCDEAIDFLSLLGTLDRVLTSGNLPDEIEYPGSPGLILGEITVPTTSMIRAEHNLIPFEDLVKELQQYVAKRVHSHALTNLKNNQRGKYIQLSSLGHAPDNNYEYTNIKTLLPTIIFIEGFLLFTSPHGPTHDPQKLQIFHTLPPTYDLITSQLNQRSLYQRIAALTSNLEIKDDPTSALAREEIEEAIWGTSIQAKYLLQAKFDVQLFLSTGEEKARERRLRREAYVDFPEGKRVAGQMWKTRGYFEDVAWRNHVEEHRWLIEESDVREGESGVEEMGIWKGVNVMKTNASVEETLRWAVDIVLDRLFRRGLRDLKEDGKSDEF